MSSWTDGLEPALLWTRFEELTRIARPSKGEGPARAHVLAWARERRLDALTDEAGNVVVRVPATPGRERAPTLVLQSHLDMVCERDPESAFDPRDGRIDVRVEGDWVRAEGTTLGADNGIGVAAALAIVDDAVEHGPLELLFTVSEEQGLDGAKALDPSLVTGRRLLNLDGTSDEALTVGCAGSDHTLLEIALDLAPSASETGLRVVLAGAKGGHSGGDIAAGRVNALKALAHVLASAPAGIRLGSFSGGVSRNAIPREAHATVAVPPGGEEAFRAAAEAALAAIAQAHAGTDDGLTLTSEREDVPVAASAATTRGVLDVLEALPTGVLVMSRTLPGVVETSTSLTTAVTAGTTLTLGSMTRSSDAAALDEVLVTMDALASSYGADLTVRRSYGPWEPALDSSLLSIARGTYARLFGVEPTLTVVHGGLECAVLGEKLAGVEMLAIGPEIVGPHAPGERVRITSAQRFQRLLGALLDDLSR